MRARRASEASRHIRFLAFLAAHGLLAGSTALAQRDVTAPSALEEVFSCAALADAVGKLACYDAAVERLRRAYASGDLAIVGRAQAHEIEREAFGFSLPSLPGLFSPDRSHAALAELREARSAIAQLRRRRDGKAVFTMADGQIWEQIDTTDTSPIQVGRAALIRRAALGSYVLSAEGAPAAVRVRRVQ